MKYYANIQCSSAKEALSSNTPAIAALKKECGAPVAYAIMVKLIKNLVTFFNVGKSMNDAQVAETVELVFKEYYFLNIADFKVCFDGMKLGKYLDGGKLFDRLDGQIILGALSEYCEERSNTAETLYLEKAKELKQAETEVKYLVQVGYDYIRESDTRYVFEPKKELATTYTYNSAYALKTLLLQNNYEGVKMVNEKQISGLMDKLLVDKPDLVDSKTKYHYATQDYYDKKKGIEASDMTEFEKFNAIRALSELLPFTIKEYADYLASIGAPRI